jgi:hypothetical protein
LGEELKKGERSLSAMNRSNFLPGNYLPSDSLVTSFDYKLYGEGLVCPPEFFAAAEWAVPD